MNRVNVVGALGLAILLAVGACGPGAASVGQGSGRVIFPTKMVSPTTGWALVGESELWRTTDSGATWTNASPPHLSDRVVNADLNYFFDGKRAWITELGGGRPASPGFYWVTFRTVDGGRSWLQGDSLPDPFWPASAQQHYIDADTGWLLFSKGDPSHTTWPILYGTHDGGLHWSLITSKAGSGVSAGTAIPCTAAMTFLSAATGWVSLGFCEQTPSQNGATVPDLRWVRDVFLVTHDGGSTWQIQALPITPAIGTRFDAPVFFDGLHGILVVVGSPSILLATSDGGTTWSARTLPGESQANVDFVDPIHGWAIAGPSSMFAKTKDDSQRIISLPLYHTDDGGLTWSPVRTNVRLEQPVGVVYSNVYFVDQKIGFVTLATLASGPSEFLKTTDGGRTWKAVLVCRAGLGWSNPPSACPRVSP